MNLIDSYLQWVAEKQPEYLENLLETDKLEDHLEDKRVQVKAYGNRLRAKGLEPWQVLEYQTASLMPQDTPEPMKKLSRVGRTLLRNFLHRDQEIVPR